MPQADSAYITIRCKPGCACPACLDAQDWEIEREPAFLSLYRRDLRDCFEGCIPFREAIEMVGAPDHYRKALRADWRRWTRRAG
jgi:hypothetical protein